MDIVILIFSVALLVSMGMTLIFSELMYQRSRVALRQEEIRREQVRLRWR